MPLIICKNQGWEEEKAREDLFNRFFFLCISSWELDSREERQNTGKLCWRKQIKMSAAPLAKHRPDLAMTLPGLP